MRDRAIGPIENVAAATIVYEDLKPILDKTVGHFARTYHQDYEEARNEANLIFVQEYTRYLANPTQPFDTWLRYCVNNQLIDKLRESYAKCRRPEGGWVTGETAMAMVTDVRNNRTLEDLTDELSPDAKEVALLALDLPEEIQAEVDSRGGKPGNTRKVIRQYLKNKGWTSARVTQAYEEIRDTIGTVGS